MDSRKYFDKLGIAQEMEKTGKFHLDFRQQELNIYAAYLRWKIAQELGKSLEEFTRDENKRADQEVERKLIEFSQKAYVNFNYNVNYVEIDRAVDYCRTYKLLMPDPTPITVKEWETIMSIDNDDYRRVLFVSLVDAKYYSLNHTTIGQETSEVIKYWNRMSDAEVLKAAKTNLKSSQEKTHVWYYLYQHKFVGISTGRNKIPYVNIVDNDSEVLDYITDYDHLDLHYDKLMGAKIGCCKKCGKLFRQTERNNGQYCYPHRGYQKVEVPKTKTIKCADCGEEFTVSAKNNKTFRCKTCQNEYRKACKRIKYLENKNRT